MSEGYRKYLRLNRLPHVWCAGCGNGMIVKAMIDSIAALGYSQDDVVVISGIGCAGRTPFILDFNTMHTTHGRALAFATGLKLARPGLKVIVVMGDGDASAIGGNHFIHACRRNLDLTALVFNNGIYGLTGGQLAPTTPYGKRSTTSLNGSIEPAFDIVNLALGAGAAFVARTTSFDNMEMVSLITRAIQHPGFAVIDILTSCPTYFGRLNDISDPYAMVQYLRRITVPLNGAAHTGAEAACHESACGAQPAPAERLPTGVFRDQPRPEYGALYAMHTAPPASRPSGPRS